MIVIFLVVKLKLNTSLNIFISCIMTISEVRYMIVLCKKLLNITCMHFDI